MTHEELLADLKTISNQDLQLYCKRFKIDFQKFTAFLTNAVPENYFIYKDFEIRKGLLRHGEDVGILSENMIKIFFHVFILKNQKLFKTADRLIYNMINSKNFEDSYCFKYLFLECNMNEKYVRYLRHLANMRFDSEILKADEIKIAFTYLAGTFYARLFYDNKNFGTGIFLYDFNKELFITKTITQQYRIEKIYLNLLNIIKNILQENKNEDIREYEKKLNFNY